MRARAAWLPLVGWLAPTKEWMKALTGGPVRTVADSPDTAAQRSERSGRMAWQRRALVETPPAWLAPMDTAVGSPKAAADHWPDGLAAPGRCRARARTKTRYS